MTARCNTRLLLSFLRADVTAKGARHRKFTQLVAHHVFRDQDRHMLLAVVYRHGQADHLRQHRGTARPGLDGLAAIGRSRLFHFLQQVVVNEWAFFY